MFGFLSRLFGGKNNILKDPELGKIRYLESEHGHVWAGTLRLRSVAAGRLASTTAQPPSAIVQPSPVIAEPTSISTEAANPDVQFFIDSEEMILRHESKNTILDVLDQYDRHIGQIEKKLIEDHPLLAGKEMVLQFLHIPEPSANYSSEFICGLDDQSFSAIFDKMALQELIIHE